jgi:O-antigen/teichoic acid export membrane protein
MKEYRLFAQRIGLIGLVSLFSSLSAMVLLPVLSKNMPLADFGIWSQVITTLGLVSTFILVGLPDALTRFAAAAKDQEELQEHFYTIFAMILAWGMTIVIIMFYFSQPLADSLFGGNVAVTRILPMIVLIHSLNIFLSYYFRTVQQMKRYSLFALMTIVLDLALISGLVLTGHGIDGAVAALLVARATIFFAMIFIIISSIGFKVPQFKNARAYLIFGLPLVPATLSSWVMNSSDRYVITLLLGTAAVGLYSPGYILGSIVGMLIGPLMLVLPVDLSKYHDYNRREVVETMLNRSMKYYLALAVPAVCGLSLLSEPILSVLSTRVIASQGSSITPFIAASMLLYGVSTILSNAIILQKKTVHLSLIWVGGALLNLGATIGLVRYMGILGAAIATLASFAFIFLFIAYLSSRYVRVKVDYFFLLKILLASLVMLTPILVWLPSGLWEIFVEIGICIVIYFVTLFLLGGIEKKEVAFLKDVLTKRS